MLDRNSINFRPCRSARRPHNGDAKAATKEVVPARMPAHSATALAELTPSAGRNSGMIGLSIENAAVMTNWIPTAVEHCGKAHARRDPGWPGSAEPDTANCSGVRGALATGLICNTGA